MITKSVEQSDALKQAFQDMLCVPGLLQLGGDQIDGNITSTPEVCPASSPRSAQAFGRLQGANYGGILLMYQETHRTTFKRLPNLPFSLHRSLNVHLLKVGMCFNQLLSITSRC
jgi:hypothetical protein